MTGPGDDFARVLAEAGEPDPGPRPAGWDGDALLARMRDDLAAYTAARAARWAAGGGKRRAARELYERIRRDAGEAAAGTSLPWLGDGPPPFRLL